MQTTFTVLVTLEHDKGQGHSPSRIAEIVQTALEEGTSVSGGFASAQVDAFAGVIAYTGMVQTTAEGDRLRRILPLHNATVPA